MPHSQAELSMSSTALVYDRRPCTNVVGERTNTHTQTHTRTAQQSSKNKIRIPTWSCEPFHSAKCMCVFCARAPDPFSTGFVIKTPPSSPTSRRGLPPHRRLRVIGDPETPDCGRAACQVSTYSHHIERLYTSGEMCVHTGASEFSPESPMSKLFINTCVLCARERAPNRYSFRSIATALCTVTACGGVCEFHCARALAPIHIEIG